MYNELAVFIIAKAFVEDLVAFTSNRQRSDKQLKIHMNNLTFIIGRAEVPPTLYSI
jgi:hypothetical protein